MKLNKMNYIELCEIENKIKKLKSKAIENETVWKPLRYYDKKTRKEIVIDGYEFGYHQPSDSFFVRNAKTKTLMEKRYFSDAKLYYWYVSEYTNEKGEIKRTISSKKLETMIYYSSEEEYLDYQKNRQLREEYMTEEAKKFRISREQFELMELGLLTLNEIEEMNKPL